MVDSLATKLEGLEEGAGQAFKKDILPLAQRGPLDLDQYFQDMQKEAEAVDKVISEPEVVLEAAGIPTSSIHATFRTTPRVEPPAPPPPVLNRAPEPDSSIQVGIEREMQQREELRKEQEELNAEVAGDIQRSVRITEAIAAGRIADPELQQMYQELDKESLDIRRHRAIQSGMEKVIEDTNELDTLDDLDARAKVRQRIIKTTKQVKDEIAFGKKTGVLPRDIPRTSAGDSKAGVKTAVTPSAPLPTAPKAPVDSKAVSRALAKEAEVRKRLDEGGPPVPVSVKYEDGSTQTFEDAKKALEFVDGELSIYDKILKCMGGAL
jgi:hypothetical protein